MTTLAECIRLHEVAQVNRDPSRPIRVIRVLAAPAWFWRSSANRQFSEHEASRVVKTSAAHRCRQALRTSEHLGVTVGLVTGDDYEGEAAS